MSSSLGETLIDFNDFLGELGSNTEDGRITFIDNTEKKTLTSSISMTEDSKTNFSKGTVNVLEQSSRKSSYYFISDFQDETIEGIRDAFYDTTSNYHIMIHNDLNQYRNIHVDTLYILPSLEDASNYSVYLKLRTYNYESGNIVVKLLSDDKQVSSIVKEISEIDIIKFDVPKDKYGSYKIVLEGDDVAYDNTFYFVIDEKSKLNITLVDNGKTGYLKEVFGNDDLFNLQVYDLNTLSYQELEKSDLIILNDFYELPNSLFNQLKNVSFLILPNDSVDIDSYSQQLNLDFQRLTPASSEIDFDYKHPLFKGVFEKSLDAGLNPKSSPVFSVRGEYNEIINYRSGDPFLLYNNQTYLLNLILNENTTFQSNALFVPILYQIAFSISGELIESYYYPKNNIGIKTKLTDVPIKLKNNDTEYIPEYNVINSEIFLELPSQLTTGIYAVVNGSDTIRTIAVNLPKSESTMLAPTSSDFNNAFSSMENVSISELIESPDRSLLLTLESQTSLWKYALILALLLIVIETLLHRYLK